MLISALVSVIIGMTAGAIQSLSMFLLPVLLRIPVAMLIVVFSHIRVEGMALAKISGQIPVRSGDTVIPDDQACVPLFFSPVVLDREELRRSGILGHRALHLGFSGMDMGLI